MDQIRTLSVEIPTDSERQFQQASEATRNESRLLETITIAASAVLFVMLLASAFVIKRGLRRREALIGELQKNQELLTNSVLYVPAAVSMVDRDMRYLQVSNLWCVNHRRERSEVVGRTLYECFPVLPEPERWKGVYQRCLAGETFRSEEEAFDWPDGRRSVLRLEMRPWGTQGGLPEGLIIFSEDITARKEAEAKMREQHERLEKIALTAPGALCSFRMQPDGSTSIPYASPGFRTLFPSLPDVQHDASPLWAAMHPDDIEPMRASMAESARTMTPWRGNYRILDPGGKQTWVEGHSMPARDPDGGITWYGFLTDITESKKLEYSLREARQEYRTLIDNSPDVICRFDREFRYAFMNRRVLDATGLPEEALIGKRVDELSFPPDFSERWMSGLRQAAESGQPIGAEYAFPTPAGETLWEIRMIPERSADGSVQTVLTIGLDITERRRAESATKEREAIIEALFEMASQAILGVGSDGTIQLANRMAGEMFGYEQGELPGKAIEILVPERHREKHLAHRQSFAAKPSKRPMGVGLELEGRRKDGSTFPVEVALSHVNTSTGFLGVSFVTDITLRKRQELALRENIRELQALSTALLTAEEDAARKIARELHDDISQRLAFLSMEIGRAASNPPAAGELVPCLRSYQGRILDVSDGIRKISHQMHPSILDDLGLSAALESLCLDMERADGIRVTFEASNVPENIDRTTSLCLYRVGQECLRNVSKHARADEASVVLAYNEGGLELTIRDSGVGFDPASRKGGLGTYSVQERVKAVRGAVTLDSRPGEGTRVVIRIPWQEEGREYL